MKALLVLFFFLASSALAAEMPNDFGVLVGAGFNSASISEPGNPSINARAGVAAGLMGTHWFHDDVGLELDAIYAFRQYGIYANSAGPLYYHASVLEFPLFVRYEPMGGVSLGVGPYLAEVLGAPPVYTTDRTEAGLAGSLRFISPARSGFRVLVDVRYLLGLTNQDGSGVGTYRQRQTEILGGLQLTL